MVKNITKVILFLIILYGLVFLSGCRNDILGLFTSNDLDERLKERDNFIFLKPEDRSLSFGTDYSFIVLAETHIEDGNTHGLEKLKDVTNGSVKFAIILGDITQNGAEHDINKFKEIAGTLGVPCYPVIGNHDIFFGNWKNWKEHIGSTSYKIDGDGTTLFILDSANSFFGKEQLDWLQREINNTQGRVFVFTHSNLFVTGPVDMQQLNDTRERARLMSILRNRCDIMFMGHSHTRLINEAGNVIYINIEDFRKSKTYCLVSVKPSGITYEFKKLF